MCQNIFKKAHKYLGSFLVRCQVSLHLQQKIFGNYLNNSRPYWRVSPRNFAKRAIYLPGVLALLWKFHSAIFCLKYFIKFLVLLLIG